MNFDNYYSTQARENIPVFRGSRYQRGYGFGSVFKNLFRWIVPIVKQHAKPIVKNVGKQALKTAVNIATDTLDGKDLKSSVKSRMKDSLANLSTQYGSGKKKHYKKNYKTKNSNSVQKKKIQKRKLEHDIFD